MLTTRLTELMTERTELLTLIREKASLWRKAAKHMLEYEKACLLVDECIMSKCHSLMISIRMTFFFLDRFFTNGMKLPD